MYKVLVTRAMSVTEYLPSLSGCKFTEKAKKVTSSRNQFLLPLKPHKISKTDEFGPDSLFTCIRSMRVAVSPETEPTYRLSEEVQRLCILLSSLYTVDSTLCSYLFDLLHVETAWHNFDSSLCEIAWLRKAALKAGVCPFT